MYTRGIDFSIKKWYNILYSIDENKMNTNSIH